MSGRFVRSCSHNAVGALKDGRRFCKLHSPESEAKRQAASSARYAARLREKLVADSPKVAKMRGDYIALYSALNDIRTYYPDHPCSEIAAKALREVSDAS